MLNFEPPIVDWDDAYSNQAHVPDRQEIVENWPVQAAAFRATQSYLADIPYGKAPREVFDLFKPEGLPLGLFVFVHGGFWSKFDKSNWSHLAKGPLARGWAVAMPSYTLCPDNSVAGIVKQVATAITVAADQVEGPIILAGHSAGGHLVARMGCSDGLLSPDIARRVRRIISISGMHDLRSMLFTEHNKLLNLDIKAARLESPALLEPIKGLQILCVAGAGELAEFRRQNALLANIWRGAGANTMWFEEEGKHHLSIIDGLASGEAEWLVLEENTLVFHGARL